MKKTGVMPKPFQVEVPLACILPDMIQLTLSELLKKEERESKPEVPVSANLSWWDKLQKYVGGGVKAIASAAQAFLPEKFSFAADVLEELINIVDDELTRPIYEKEEEAKKKTEELKQKKAESLQKVADEKTALLHSVNCFRAIIDRLEKDFPASRLKV
jgi:alpha-galactosidase/6-phospho-beta-glucosidase family protein